MMITLRQMQFLTVLADTLNFSRAAEQCFVTQPTLSAAIKEIEEILGVALFERTRRNVMLTPVGREIAERARALLLDAREIERIAAAHANQDEGDLHFGAIPTIGPYLIPSALPDLRERFPRMNFYLREEMTESLIDGLESGRLDLALLALPFEIGGLESHSLFKDGYQLAVPDDWDRAPSIVSGPDLEDGKLLLLEKGHCLQRHALQAFPEKNLKQDDSFAATSLTTLIAMVSEGLGITLLPNLAVDAGVVGASDIRLIPLPDACPRNVVLVWRATSARKQVFREIGEILSGTRHELEGG